MEFICIHIAQSVLDQAFILVNFKNKWLYGAYDFILSSCNEVSHIEADMV
jgi:hypothetical protein